MRSIFSSLTNLSVRFRWITLVITIVVIALGVRAGTLLQQELLPPVEFPQTIVLAQVTGMDSQQVLKVVTERLEAEISAIPEIVNIDSTTTGAFGAVIVAANDFGLDQERLKQSVQEAIDRVWFPSRQISPPEGETAQAFAQRLISELDSQTLLYLAEERPNFVFQLSSTVWEFLSPEATQSLLAYLARQVSTGDGKSALQRLVEQQIVPQVNALDSVANVAISGGQILPDEQNNFSVSADVDQSLSNNFLFQLSPEAWAIASAKLNLDTLDQAAVDTLQAVQISIPQEAPALPEAWRADFFETAQDLLEIETATRSIATTLNTFMTTGTIKGAKGTTADLTVQDIETMLAIDSSMVNVFSAEQLVALPADIFAALPADYLASLDGFTRDELAAKALAQTITGEQITPQPVSLPNAWRIQPPQIITFSFADIPLATFSVFSTGENLTNTDTVPEPSNTPEVAGGGLTQLLTQLGGQLLANVPQAENELSLAQEWASLSSRPEFANQALTSVEDLVRYGQGSGASILNRINSQIPQGFEGYEVRLFNSLTPAQVSYLLAQESDFYQQLDEAVLLKFSPQVLQTLSTEVLASLSEVTRQQIQAIASGNVPSAAQSLAERYQTDMPASDPNAPALNADWGFVANFLGIELNNASDFFRFPQTEKPAEFINALFDSPQGVNFAPNLLGNLSLEAFNYLAERDASFVEALVPRALNLLSEDVKASLPAEIQERATQGEVFRPTSSVTRTNGASSLLVTIFKSGDANTVSTYYQVREIIEKLDAENPNIEVVTAFEQSSFIEKSISGVIREGSLGAVFAIIIILVFLSGGVWSRQGRSITGILLVLVSLLFLGVLLAAEWGAAEADLMNAWNRADVVLRLLTILGVGAGALFVVWGGTLPYPAWRSTLVIAVSIPLSILSALALMYWLPPFVNSLLQPYAESGGLAQFLLRLFPDSLTLNIMTLSGLTVAIGRVVDDSIVVLENIFRQIQSGMSKQEAILSGTREVSLAIFSATGVTVIVFLPLGLTGGLIGEFFLPFGLAVTYSLAASFLVAVTVVPALASLFVSEHDVVEEADTWMERTYAPVLKLALKNNATRWGVIVLAIASAGFGAYLFGTRPAAFLPSFGEEQLTININLPAGTGILETNEIVKQAETVVQEVIPSENIVTLRTIIGGGGLNFESLISGNQISENRAEITVSLVSTEQIESYVETIEERLEPIFASNAETSGESTSSLISSCREVTKSESYSVGATTLTSSGGFGGFELVMTGANQADLQAYDACITYALNGVEGLQNVTSNLAQAGIAQSQCPEMVFRGRVAVEDTDAFRTALHTSVTSAIAEPVIVDSALNEGELCLSIAMVDSDKLASFKVSVEEALQEAQVNDIEVTDNFESLQAPVSGESDESTRTFIRSNTSPAISYAGEVTTEDTINLAPRAIRLLNEQVPLPEGISIGQGFDTQFQTEGFAGIFVAMGIAIVIVVFVLVFLFASPIYWLAVIFSIIVAPVGAAIALSLTNRVLGISALIGLLMLLGLVVTNAIVLIDRVGQNRYEKGMNLYDSLVEAGSRRLRPILMTSLATIIALLPLAAGLSEGAIIAAELGTVVIGGVFSSTILTLLVVPAAYYLFTPVHNFFIRRRNR